MSKKKREDIENVSYQETGYFSYRSGKLPRTPDFHTSKLGPAGVTIQLYGPSRGSWLSSGDEGYVHAVDPFSEWEEDPPNIMPKNWYGHSPLVEHEAQLGVVRAKISKLLLVVDTHRAPEDDRDIRELSEDVRPQPGQLPLARSPETDLGPVSRFQRWCWLLLTVATLGWGVVTGAAFWHNSFPIAPAYALLVAFLLIGLALTLFWLGREE